MFQCGGVSKQHYLQMVELDQSEIELQWECPPCATKRLRPDDEPPQQTVAVLARPRLTPADSVITICPSPPVSPSASMQRSQVAPATNGVSRHNGAGTNGVNDVPGRLSFQDVRIRDLPFYPVKATLLRPCSLVLKDKDSQVRTGSSEENNALTMLLIYMFTGSTKSELGILFNSRTGKHSQQWHSKVTNSSFNT